MGKTKRIAMVSVDHFVNKALSEQLNAAFQYEVEVIPIFLREQDKIDTTNLDLIVCTSEALIDEIKKKATDEIPIIAVKRTINLKNISELINLNDGERVLVVNNHVQTTYETINELKKLGVNHLEFIPYYPGSENTVEKIAVTPGGAHLVPSYVERIIDLGVRLIELSSVIEIFMELNLPKSHLKNISERYSMELINVNLNNIEINKMLKGIFNVTNDGIAALDLSGNVFFANEKFAKLLDYNYNDLLSKNITDIISSRNIIDKILGPEHVEHELVRVKDREFVFNKTFLHQNKAVRGYIFGIQEVDYIQNLEREVRKRIIDKGFTARHKFEDLVGVSPKLTDKIKIAKKVAKTDLTVLIQGDDGTGKEIFAQAIHNTSDRRNEAFVAVNFAAISESLLESELFGYREGAFTGAIKGGKAGLFEQADKGTIFLDEIGDTSPQIQTRLLRVLQEKEIMRVGGNKIIPVDVRVIAATNKDLLKLVEEGKFRKDLYYRLKVLYFDVPPLNERKEDIPLLTQYFLAKLGSDKELSEEVKELFFQYSWPGNIRELENLMYYIDSIVEKKVVTKNDLPEEFLRSIEKNTIKDTSLDWVDIGLIPQGQLREYIAILEVLEQTKKLNLKVGRGKISQILNSKGLNITPEQVRLRIKDLDRRDLVKIGSTKQGTSITPKGLHFLREYNRGNIGLQYPNNNL